jgi:hypothetical protein
MAKGKQPVIEIEFVASFSEQSERTEGNGGPDVEAAETSEASRNHDELVTRYAELASRAQTLSEEIAIQRYSESHLDESRRNLDWSIATDRHDHFKLLMPPTAALAFLDAVRPDLVEIVEAGGSTITSGRTTIDLEKAEDIDKAVAFIKKLSEPKAERSSGKKKKADAKKDAKVAKPKKTTKKRYLAPHASKNEFRPALTRSEGLAWDAPRTNQARVTGSTKLNIVPPLGLSSAHSLP